jgi:hypothetical protein
MDSPAAPNPNLTQGRPGARPKKKFNKANSALASARIADLQVYDDCRTHIDEMCAGRYMQMGESTPAGRPIRSKNLKKRIF